SKKAFDTQLDTVAVSFNEKLNELNSKLTEANKIVNIIWNVGVTGNYQKIANENDFTANLLRVGAVFFMVLMSSLLVWSIIDLSKADFDLYKSVARILA